MNRILTIPLTLCVLLATAAFSVLDTSPLDNDPVFKKVIRRRLTYPSVRNEYKVAIMVHARFSVDERGHVRNVQIIRQPTEEAHHKFYDAVVQSTLNRLPPLNPNYVGHYILPVVFSLRDHQNGELLVPPDTDYHGDHANSVVLQTVNVLGDKHYRTQN